MLLVSESSTESADREEELERFSGYYTDVTTTAGAEEEAVLEVTVEEFEGLLLTLPSSRQWMALWCLLGKPLALQVEQTCR